MLHFLPFFLTEHNRKIAYEPLQSLRLYRYLIYTKCYTGVTFLRSSLMIYGQPTTKD